MENFYFAVVALLAWISSCSGASVIFVKPATYPALRYRSVSEYPPSPAGLSPLQWGIPTMSNSNNFRSILLVPALLYAPVKSDQDKGNETASSNGKERSDGGEEPKKPRCLQSLFGWYAKKKLVGALENFDAPNLPDFRAPPGTGVQGGVVVPPGGSQLTPDLTQANNALSDAQLMESQVNSAQSQLNSQLAGVPGSGIPLSSQPPLLRQDMNGAEMTSTGSETGYGFGTVLPEPQYARAEMPESYRQQFSRYHLPNMQDVVIDQGAYTSHDDMHDS